MNGNNGGGPCGACKYLRKKCVKSCIFAPYFDSDQGTAHFAAVHKVFGASNASKLLTKIPPHKRLDAVVSLCYEALARLRDPVYGCVGHIFSLQQQMVNLQAELSYIQARLSILQRFTPPPPSQYQSPPTTTGPHGSSLDTALMSDNMVVPSNISMLFHHLPTHDQFSSAHEITSINLNPPLHQELDQNGDDLQALPRDFVLRYFSGVRSRPPTSSS